MVVSGSLRGAVRELVDGEITIGRAESNHLRLTDSMVSRQHCMIRQVEERYELTDLDSHNGTFVNGVPVRNKAVDHGAKIRVGSSELLFLVHEGEESGISGLCLSDEPTMGGFTTIRVGQPILNAPAGIEVGRMARHLAALFRIREIINSVRDIGFLI